MDHFAGFPAYSSATLNFSNHSPVLLPRLRLRRPGGHVLARAKMTEQEVRASGPEKPGISAAKNGEFMMLSGSLVYYMITVCMYIYIIIYI
jgi:hypothetical protein